MTEKYRFDDAYSNVYIYSPPNKAYLFHCSYLAAGIKAKDSDRVKTRKADEILEHELYLKDMEFYEL